MNTSVKRWKIFLAVLVLLISTIILAIADVPDDKLHIITCDVGQGDATLIIYKNNQILIDGGPNSSVMDCLNRYIPFWDKTIEVVVMTHPQTDHYTGLIDIYKNFTVKMFVGDGLDASSQSYQVLKSLVRGGGSSVVNPYAGTKMRLDLIYLDIVWPKRSFINQEVAYVLPSRSKNILGAYTSKLDPNEFSIVAVLSFNKFRGIFTGDIGPGTEDAILAANILKPVNYIKIPHHGSKNGLTEDFLKILRPEVAVISVGKHNSYGHPSPEIINLLKSYNVETYRTDEMGDIEILVDDKSFVVRNVN